MPTGGEVGIRAEVEAILADGVTTDAAEDAQHGSVGSDELPVELPTRNGRLARPEAALSRIEAEEGGPASGPNARGPNGRNGPSMRAGTSPAMRRSTPIQECNGLSQLPLPLESNGSCRPHPGGSGSYGSASIT